MEGDRSIGRQRGMIRWDGSTLCQPSVFLTANPMIRPHQAYLPTYRTRWRDSICITLWDLGSFHKHLMRDMQSNMCDNAEQGLLGGD